MTRNDSDRPRVALVADGLGTMHGVTHAIQQIRERGVPGYDVEVIGTDADVDRRLSAVAEIEVPYYRGMHIGVPGVPALTEALAEGRYDLVHLCSPGPAGIGAWLLARVARAPGDRQLSHRAGRLRRGAQRPSANRGAGQRGTGRLLWRPAHRPVTEPGVGHPARAARCPGDPDHPLGSGRRIESFDPGLRTPGRFAGEVNVLYAGRLTTEKGVDRLAEAFEAARSRDPRLHLVLAGGGPEEAALRERLGDSATFLGWLGGRDLAVAYASADLFAFASRTDTFGQVILEAQASGLPVVAVNEGGPASLIADGETGLLTGPEPAAMTEGILRLAQQPALHARIRKAGLAVTQGRTWEASLARLAAGYRTALLRAPAAGAARHVA
ncbi:MAG: glycosyltransferase [Actinomycetota bacterium]|nr:glycosyltransferase [Actinomycetota bacterium]